MEKKDICPYCGCEEVVIGRQRSNAKVEPLERHFVLREQELYHVICLKCGSVIRSYVKKPEKLKCKKKRK